ncbi:unnamed protein product [Rhizophagus irregularis]|nr:unnamed protein product [Rhizophagus irregularis]
MDNRFSENLESSYERKTIADTPTIFCPEIETNVETTPPAINDANERALATEFVQDLLSPDSQIPSPLVMFSNT